MATAVSANKDNLEAVSDVTATVITTCNCVSECEALINCRINAAQATDEIK